MPVVLLADPVPPKEPVRVPARFQYSAPERFAVSGIRDSGFAITYVPAGQSDIYGMDCASCPLKARTAIETAAAIWADILDSPVPITIRVCWAERDMMGTLGYSGGGSLHLGFAGAPRDDVWYMASLANFLSRTDLDTDNYDMHITFSSAFPFPYTWYYETDGNASLYNYDLLTVALHEIAHGLNFAGTMQYSSSNNTARWGQQGYANIYDIFMYKGEDLQLVDTYVFRNPSQSLGQAVRSEDIWFGGEAAMAANGGSAVKMYAPGTWRPGSSYSHLDMNAFSGTGNALMVPSMKPGVSIHDPGPVTCGILQDLGWQITDVFYSINFSVQGQGTIETDKQGPYPSGTRVRLTATPAAGYGFSHWRGDVSGTDRSVEITVNRDKNITAVFKQLFTLRVNQGAHGTITPDRGSYFAGTRVRLTATANAGYRFLSWQGDLSGSVNPEYLVMDSDKIVSASFTETEPEAVLYYPHVECSNGWQSRICAINTGTGDIAGQFLAHDRDGFVVDAHPCNLAQLGRVELEVNEAFANAEAIRYISFMPSSAGTGQGLVGYSRFERPDTYRAALPAVSRISEDDIHITHIACNKNWWTGIALVNTTDMDKNLTIVFNTGETRLVELPAESHRSFTISSLFARNDLTDLESAVIMESSGVIGLELFGGSGQLGGVPLSDEAATWLYYPHVTSAGSWRTGLVAYNPGPEPCLIDIYPYTENGVFLGHQEININGGQKYFGVAGNGFELPVSTDWFAMRASHKISGFQLFGQQDLLAGFSASRPAFDAGVFAGTREDRAYGGWIGISLVNPGDTETSVTLRAMDDSGRQVAVTTLNLGPYEKLVGLPSGIFSDDISAATYLIYTSDAALAGFQLSGYGHPGSRVLDGLPVLPMGHAAAGVPAMAD